MVRPCLNGLVARSIAILGVSAATLLSVPAASLAQSASDAESVQMLTSMLNSIDPYRPSSQVSGKLHIHGSTSMDAMAHGWVSGFKQFHEKADVEISAAGSESTFAELAKNPCAVGMYARPIRQSELDELKKSGLKQPVAFEVAREALGVFVNPQNPVTNISGEILRSVFTTREGEAPATWKLLGATGEWADKPINVISRTENSGTQQFLKDFVFHSSQLRPGTSAFDSNAEVVAAVGKDSLAIAICGLKCGGTSARALKLTAGATEIPSDDHAVLSGQYPLTRPLTLVIDVGQTNEEAKMAQEFVRYALCQAGQTQAILAGFFPVDLPLLRAGIQKLDANPLR